MEVRAVYVLTILTLLFVAAAVAVAWFCVLEVLYLSLLIGNVVAVLTAYMSATWTSGRLDRDGRQVFLVANRESYPTPVKFLLLVGLSTLTTTMILRWLVFDREIGRQLSMMALSYAGIGTLLGVLGSTWTWERRWRSRVPMWRTGRD